jgi:hypothetical protein
MNGRKVDIRTAEPKLSEKLLLSINLFKMMVVKEEIVIETMERFLVEIGVLRVINEVEVAVLGGIEGIMIERIMIEVKVVMVLMITLVLKILNKKLVVNMIVEGMTVVRGIKLMRVTGSKILKIPKH